tara:strand:+ start:1633 stop:2457 length:825 start_codon:yes stop_codon:yes gene_type:complete
MRGPAILAALVVLNTAPLEAQLSGRGDSVARPIDCSVRASRQIELSPTFDGIVAEVFVRPGQAVVEGERLLRLSTGLEEAELVLVEARANATGFLNAARQRRTGLQARVDRLREGYEQQAVSYAEYESVELELRSAEAEVARRQEELQITAQEAGPLRRKIELATVRSPASGVIGEDILDPGEATQGQSLLTLYVLSPLRVEAFVPREQLPAVLATQRLDLTIDDRPVDQEAVVFDYVSPIADLASGTVSVFLHLESDQILPGSACEARPSPSL